MVDELAQLARDAGMSLSQLAIAWTLSHPAVDVAIVGTRNPSHVDEAVGAGDLDLDESVAARIEGVIRAATSVDGPSPEGMPESGQ
jgi:hypothetical protein